MDIVIFLIILAVLVPLIAVASSNSESTDNNNEDILRELDKRNLELIEVIVPKWTDTGPFPKFEFNIGPQTQILGIRGESTKIRLVKYNEAQGRPKESWVKIRTTAFVHVRMIWIPELE